MLIRVSRELIAAGVPTDPCACPVALALRDEFPGRRVVVTEESITVGVYAGGAFVPERDWRTPKAVREFVGLFDAASDPEAECEEFAFYLPD